MSPSSGTSIGGGRGLCLRINGTAGGTASAAPVASVAAAVAVACAAVFVSIVCALVPPTRGSSGGLETGVSNDLLRFVKNAGGAELAVAPTAAPALLPPRRRLAGGGNGARVAAATSKAVTSSVQLMFS